MSTGGPRRTVVFDVIGTLFDLEPLRGSLSGLGAPPPALEAWFQRILHEAATVTIIERYRPFEELAASALRTTLAQLDLDPDRTEPLESLAELDAYPDAAAALRRLRDARLRVATLTNGSQESTRKLLDRSGLSGLVEQVISCDEVHRFKPHRAPYELALERVGQPATMVAAHGWDVVGARAAGLDTLWIDREEREWPFPLDPPRRASNLAAAAELIVATNAP
jgi:2-haloacid dehalogenase